MNLNENEYAPFFETYVSLSKDLSLPKDLLSNKESTITFFQAIPNDKLDYR